MYRPNKKLIICIHYDVDDNLSLLERCTWYKPFVMFYNALYFMTLKYGLNNQAPMSDMKWLICIGFSPCPGFQDFFLASMTFLCDYKHCLVVHQSVDLHKFEITMFLREKNIAVF